MTFDCPVQGKKIAFVTCGYPLDVSTMLINSLALLSRHNQVDVIVSPFDSRHNLCPNWLRRLFVPAPDLRKYLAYRGLLKLARLVPKLMGERFAALAWRLKHLDLLLFGLWFRQRAKAMDYDMVIAVECHALLAVASIGVSNYDLLYYNMELLDWASTNPLYTDKLSLKKMEHAALSKVTCVLITSPRRAEIFSKINSYPLEKISILPVVPMRTSFTGKTSYFREKFKIPNDKFIVLYSGNFMPWALCLEIIESMKSWPKEAVLVMHTWDKNALKTEYFQRMQKAAENRLVFFSSEYLPYDELPKALASADVGLLFYEAIDANFTEILFSSNKFGEYMAAGLPVICSQFPSLAEFVDAQGVGCAVPVESIGAALQKMICEIETYRGHVVRCRDEFFDFECYFAKAFASYVEGKSKGKGICN